MSRASNKEELLRAVVARRAQPVVARQLQCLAELAAAETPVTVEAILTAFFEPCLQLLYQQASRRTIAAQFMGRLRWKFDLLVAVLIRVQTEAGKPGALLRSSEPEDVQAAIAQLVRFLTPGMQA